MPRLGRYEELAKTIEQEKQYNRYIQGTDKGFTMPGTPKSRHAAILQFFENHPGMTYTTVDIATETDTPMNTANTSVSRLAANSTDTGVVRSGRGMYRYVGVEEARRMARQDNPTQGNSDQPLFVQIGRSKGGRLVLQGTDDELYVAIKLEEVLE